MQVSALPCVCVLCDCVCCACVSCVCVSCVRSAFAKSLSLSLCLSLSLSLSLSTVVGARGVDSRAGQQGRSKPRDQTSMQMDPLGDGLPGLAPRRPHVGAGE